jgi:hypothetical protein
VRSCLIDGVACDDNWQQRFLPIVIGFIGPGVDVGRRLFVEP